MTRIVSVVLIGDSFLEKAGLEVFLTEFSYVSVVATFCGTEPGLGDKIIELKPEIVFIIPKEDGKPILPLLRQLSRDNSIYVCALVANEPSPEVKGKLKATASVTMDKMALTGFVKKILHEKGLEPDPEETDTKLSIRENEILKYVACGLTNQQIADRLFLSVHTVTTHRKNITKKLGIKSVSGLTVYAMMNKLVLPSEIEKRH